MERNARRCNQGGMGGVVSASQRRKGAGGEREAYRLLADQLGDIVERRDLSQSRDGGGDIRIPAARVLVEVKRVERSSIPAWLRQARQSAEVQGEDWVGVVLWRRNGGEWTAYRPVECGQDGERWESFLPEFCAWVRERL